MLLVVNDPGGRLLFVGNVSSSFKSVALTFRIERAPLLGSHGRSISVDVRVGTLVLDLLCTPSLVQCNTGTRNQTL
jgi:hypothetical protein